MAGRGFNDLRNDTARDYLINSHARTVYHVLKKSGTDRSKCYAIAMKLRRRLLLGEVAFPSIGVRDERRKLTGACAYCGHSADTVDHLIPRLRHGPDSADNLVPACRWCNSSKGSRDVFDWATSKEFFPLAVVRRYLVLAWRWTERAELLDAPLETLCASNPPFLVGGIPWSRHVAVTLKRERFVRR